MSVGRDLRRETESYLIRHGWHRGESGQAGEMWRHIVNESALGGRIAVPYEVGRNSRALDAISRRVSLLVGRPALVVQGEIEDEFLDGQNYRIADTHIVDDTVDLDAAATLLTSARRMVRAAATTARKPRAYIGSNFSAPADEIASKARLSHTRHGSYVLPVVMPVDPPPQAQDQLPADYVEVESTERRVTRTMATALDTLQQVVVRSSTEPNVDAILHLIETGVSKELVVAVRSIAIDSGVHAFDVSFKWAHGVQAPGGVPERVLIPSEASTLLRRVETKLQQTKPQADESVSGQIIEIRHIPDDPTGEVAIQTIRNNRSGEVRITATRSIIEEAYDWAKSNRAVVARGAITTQPGRKAEMLSPAYLRPLDLVLADM